MRIRFPHASILLAHPVLAERPYLIESSDRRAVAWPSLINARSSRRGAHRDGHGQQVIQDILAEAERLTAEDRRGVNPLFTSNMTPYGEVKLNMTSRLDLSDLTPPPPETEALAA